MADGERYPCSICSAPWWAPDSVCSACLYANQIEKREALDLANERAERQTAQLVPGVNLATRIIEGRLDRDAAARFERDRDPTSILDEPDGDVFSVHIILGADVDAALAALAELVWACANNGEQVDAG